MRNLIALAIAGMTISTASHAADPKPWYETHPQSVKTLKQAVAEERDFLSIHFVDKKLVKWPQGNPYWHGYSADPRTCAALKSVGITCDYNTHTVLTNFLTVNGKGIFPSAGKTNPYYGPSEHASMLRIDPQAIDDSYIGQARQNAMLAAAVRRNARLFHNGDLTAADVRTKWH